MTAARGFSSAELAQVKQEPVVDDRVNMALIQGDLSRLSPNEKRDYYLATCRSLGLNPLTKPFEYLRLNNREVLYATKACTEQMRQLNGVSARITAREVVEGCYIVTCSASTPAGRTDEAIGAVAIDGLKGENRANAMMKAETKAKRRVTLSICGLGMLDESEIESIPGARVVHDVETGEVLEQPAEEPPQADKPPSKAFDMLSSMLTRCTDMAQLESTWKAVDNSYKSQAISVDERNQLASLKQMTAKRLKETPREPGIDDV